MSTLAKICKRTIEREKKKGALSEEFIADMTEKLNTFWAAGKITTEEYSELIAMMAE